MVARWTHVSQGLPQASRVKDQSPTVVGRTWPTQVSSPVGSGAIRTVSTVAPAGSASVTVSPMLSWPSRNAVARTGMASPTAAAAGRRPPRLVGDTSVIGNRPASSGGGSSSRGRQGAAGAAGDTAGESGTAGAAGVVAGVDLVRRAAAMLAA